MHGTNCSDEARNSIQIAAASITRNIGRISWLKLALCGSKFPIIN